MMNACRLKFLVRFQFLTLFRDADDETILALDPATGASLGLALDRFSQLEAVQLRDIGAVVRSEERDLAVLQSMLCSWRPRVASGDSSSTSITIGISANAYERSKAAMLALVCRVGDVVEKPLSGLRTTSVAPRHTLSCVCV